MYREQQRKQHRKMESKKQKRRSDNWSTKTKSTIDNLHKYRGRPVLDKMYRSCLNKENLLLYYFDYHNN